MDGVLSIQNFGRTVNWSLILLSTLAVVVRADVDVVVMTSTPMVRVGDKFQVNLVAVSDLSAGEDFIGLDALLIWDPTVLALRADLGGSPFSWTFSSFPEDVNLDGLNADCGPFTFCDNYTGLPFNDGDAFYQAISLFTVTLPRATTDGLLITTLVFEALSPTATTQIGLLSEFGFTSTRVVASNGGQVFMVTGLLVPDDISVASCGERGDFDGNCLLELSDFSLFEPCMTGPDDVVEPINCGPADVDVDGDADLRDFQLIQLLFVGSF